MRWSRLALVLLCHCGPAAPPPEAPAPPPPEVPAPTSLLSAAEAWAAADARSPAPLLPALDSPSGEDRARATLALARLHDPAVRPLLLRRLLDPVPSVREAASLGLGALGPDPVTETALLGALAAEREPPLRPALLRDLGRAGSAAIVPTLEAALAADLPGERAAACHAAAQLAQGSVALPEAFLLTVAREAAASLEPATAIACAHAIVRAAPTPGLTAALQATLRSPDPSVRGMGVRALGRCPDVRLADLEPALADADPTVALLALRALAGHAELPGADAATVRTLRGLHARVLAAPDGPRLVPSLLGGLEAVPLRWARVREVLDAVEAMRSETRAALSTDPSFDTLDCGFARLVDLGRGWPGRVESCGGEHTPASERARLAAELLGALEGAEVERGGALARLADDPSPVVREAAASSLGALDDLGSRPSLLTLLSDPDLGVVVSAVEGLTRRIERAQAAHEAAVLAAVLANAPPPTLAWPDAGVLAALRAATERFRAEDDLEGTITALGAIGAAREPALADLPLALTRHHSLAVREAAAAALEQLDRPRPEGPFDAPPNPIAPGAIVAASPLLVEVETARGVFVIEVRPDWAPTTVSRFLGLVDDGFFDGLTFHRVVPGFVVQGGDPRGDGYGGPGWSQRCEDNRVAYERGTVGMALAGRDTGGSQFFVTLTPQPHLDGRYTAFGRVIEGMEVVERMVRGDALRDVRRR